jgi:hypothetical protein
MPFDGSVFKYINGAGQYAMILQSGVASLPALRTYNCKQCGVTVMEVEEPRERRDN